MFKSEFRLNICKPAQQHGFTLIELMISIVIGLIILSAILGLLVSMIKADSDNIKASQLNQELRAAMSLMTRDIRRSGYNGNATVNVIGNTANPFQEMATNFDVTDPATCIIYAYDEDKDGVDDGNSERFGFRFNAGAIQSRGSGADCAATSNWENITDETVVKITTFTVLVDDFDHDGNPGPGQTSAGITTHQITLTLTGELVRDPSVIRTITETVEIRNDEY
jgi:prepilin peptidase dependent protein B